MGGYTIHSPFIDNYYKKKNRTYENSVLYLIDSCLLCLVKLIPGKPGTPEGMGTPKREGE